jgi:hypothetical protein
MQRSYESQVVSLQSSTASLENKIKELESQLSRSSALETSLEESRAKSSELSLHLTKSQEYVLKLEAQNHELKQTMQATLNRLHNFSEDENLVDRRLVNQLLITYIEGKRDKREVLELMSKILQFSEEDQSRLGIGKKSLLGSISSFLSTKPSTDPGDQLAKELGHHNLADMWVDFLVNETEMKSRVE